MKPKSIYKTITSSFALLMLLSSAVAAAPGAFDSTFGIGGTVTDWAGAYQEQEIAIQPVGFASVRGFENDAPSPFRDNGKIAFTSDRDGNQEIYVMNNDGTGQTRLTNNTVIDAQPAFSPDGRRIAFFSQQTVGSSTANIKIMNVDGTNQTVVTMVTFNNVPYPSYPWRAWENRSLCWSPDGSKIAFDDEGEIFTISVTGTNRTNLTNHPANDYAPAWSPDGARILFTSYRVGYSTMHTMNAVDGSDLVQLPSMFYSWDVSPDWSPSGAKIVFTELSEDWFPTIIIADADGKNRLRFEGTGFGGGTRNMPRWSPDGAKIAFHYWKYPDDDCEIYVKNVSGGGPIQLTNTSGNNGQPSWQTVLRASSLADFDGDGRSDISVFRPSDRTWYLDRSTAGFSSTQFGISTDRIAPADFDGDGKTDISIYRDGVWWRIESSTNTARAIQFGLPGDVPVAADYTGDGRAELAVYRSGVWLMFDLIDNQSRTVAFGIATDSPVAGDYDGDGRADQAVYRNGEWHINRSSDGYTVVNFGLAADKLVQADYDGDEKIDPAVYRDGVWYLLRSSQGFAALQFGLPTDIPAAADYDGDGKTDVTIYRNGTWYILKSSNGTIGYQQFGLNGDLPIAARSQ
ncbi:MAG: hypothetical protein DMF63_12660 [Acidobacteria bacterium]|nr:MAG: hypothetical protein DMF63_12660 [Acidobacteriota bacterium]